jgi:lipopolysaccharide transport system permease protein
MNEYFQIITPTSHNFLAEIKEVVRYKDLFYIFAWRDIKIRYKQTLLGVAWVIFQPLITMAIFTVFFGKLASLPSGNLPYFLFVLIGLVFWNYFANALSHSSNSMIENENIIKKVYFPKLILPLSSVVTFFIDFGINFIVLFLLLIGFGFIPSPLALLIIPLAIGITVLTISGLGFLLSSFNVKYRDVRYILPFFIQLMLFLTPVIYPISVATPLNRFLLTLNPMSGVIESARVVLSGQTNVDFKLLLTSLVLAILIFIVGFAYFKKTERFFADIV